MPHAVRLRFVAPPELTHPDLPEALRQRCEVLDLAQTGSELSLHHALELPDDQGRSESRCRLRPAPEALSRQQLDDILEQTWTWPDAGACLSGAPYELLAESEDLSGHGPQLELAGFQTFLWGLLDTLRPAALIWPRAQKALSPDQLRGMLEDQGPGCPHAAMNVRLFQVPDGLPGETLMDTCGMAAFDLPDVQIHFRDLAPEQLAPYLLQLCSYLFGAGDVIETGHEVPGLEDGVTWECRRAVAFVEPERPALELVPHAPHDIPMEEGGSAPPDCPAGL